MKSLTVICILDLTETHGFGGMALFSFKRTYNMIHCSPNDDELGTDRMGNPNIIPRKNIQAQRQDNRQQNDQNQNSQDKEGTTETLDLKEQQPIEVEKTNNLDATKWNKRDRAWMRKYNELVAYREANGDLRVSPSDHRQLYSWIAHQRHEYKSSNMLPERVDLLNELGFQWSRKAAVGGNASKPKSTDQSRWYCMYDQLVEYRNIHGNALVPFNCEENPKLGRWADAQRWLYKSEHMKKERINLLNDLDFVWYKLEHTWSTNYKELSDFKEKNGHFDVPKNSPLRGWITRQKNQYKLRAQDLKNHLTEERVDALSAIGFPWPEEIVVKNQASWSEMFDELCKYKKLHGDTLVVTEEDNYRVLAAWVRIQRSEFIKHRDGRNSTLSKKRVDKLDSISFVWDLRMVERRIGGTPPPDEQQLPKDASDDSKLAAWRDWFKEMP
mmetsp:Transcript_10522/g.11998  ORF Transcript_10522/g.11998 Transcript_10522/m.11998 type:complete len:441 (-) Transcript_10522:167-1489(-)